MKSERLFIIEKTLHSVYALRFRLSIRLLAWPEVLLFDGKSTIRKWLVSSSWASLFHSLHQSLMQQVRQWRNAFSKILNK